MKWEEFGGGVPACGARRACRRRRACARPCPATRAPPPSLHADRAAAGPHTNTTGTLYGLQYDRHYDRISLSIYLRLTIRQAL
jgi:hypothetical protein